MDFLSSFFGVFASDVLGFSSVNPVWMMSLFVITLLAFGLLIARIPIQFAFIIVSPAILLGSFSGLFPALAFGVTVFLLGLFFAGVIMALIR